MQKLLMAALAAGTAAGLAGCVSANVTESAIYRPAAGTPLTAEVLARDAPDYAMARHRIVTSDGAELNGVLLTQPGAYITVLFFGGNAFTLENGAFAAATFAPYGVNLMMFDTRGYGTSTAGSNVAKIQSLMQDGEAIFDYMDALPEMADQKIVIHGHSLGSFVAGHVAAVRQANGVVLQSSATTTQDFANDGIPGMMRPFVKLKIEDSLKGQGNLKNMAAIDENLLVLVGEKDRQTKPPMSASLYRASPLPANRKSLAVVKGAGHDDIFEFKAGRDAYRTFLDSL